MSRIEPLKALIAQDPGNSRYRFMLAMEYRNAGDAEAAVAALEKLSGVAPDYVSAYFQAGQICEEAGDLEKARAFYQSGVECARRIGDQHALSEIQEALDLLG
jgi:tetratricopeptide (TPR) repeat protein